MKKKKYAAAVSWAIASLWLALCLYLSWQNGERTVETSHELTLFLMRILHAVGISPEEAEFHMLLRKSAHFVVFFISGALFRGAAEALWGPRPGGRLAVCGGAVTLAALLADVPKIWIPGRHLEWGESCLNAAGALAGFLTVGLFIFAARRWKKR